MMVSAKEKQTLFILWLGLQNGIYSFTTFSMPTRSMTKLNYDTSAKNILGETKAIANLEKLLERQRADMRDTENLLRALSTNVTAYHNGESNHLDNETSLSPLEVVANLGLGVDYGFISRSEGSQPSNLVNGLPADEYDSTSQAFEDYGPPSNFIDLGVKAFFRNLKAIQGERNHEDEKKISEKQKKLHAKLKQLTLDNAAIWKREEASNKVEAPLVIKIPYLFLCYLLDYVFDGKYVPSRFYLLETVARMPYFSYIAMLHLYETLGWWRRSADVKRVHFAEEWNEFHHLLIMESLGGDQEWWVRFLALHAALAYYWTLVALWMVSPTLGYGFSELLETHAVNTYSQFLDENEEILKDLPPSNVAIEYYGYGSSDPLFGEYQTSALAKGEEPRRPGDNMKTLYDVFSAIRDDEGDHVSTMKACLDPNVAVNSPSIERQVLVGAAVIGGAAYFLSTGELPFDLDMDISAAEDVVSNLVGTAAGVGEELINDEEDSVMITRLILDGSVLNSIEDLQTVLQYLMEIVSRFFR